MTTAHKKIEMKSRNISAWRGAFLGLSLAVLLLGGIAKAVTDTPAREYVARTLTDVCRDRGDASVCDGVLAWLNETSALVNAPVEAFGATQAPSVSDAGNFNLVGKCDSDVPADLCTIEGSETFLLGTASTTPISWCNRGIIEGKRHTIWIDYLHGRVFATGTGVAASMQLTVGTSTVTGTTLTGNGYNFNTSTAPNASVLDRFVIATSTMPLIDSRGGTNWSYHTDQFGNGVAATGSAKSVPLAYGECLIGHLRAFDPSRAVTSTANRGMSPQSYVTVEYHIDSTSTTR